MSRRTYVYKSFKIGFNSLFKPEEKELIERINIKVLEVNKVVYNTYSFIKSYLLYLVQNNQPLPIPNEEFIRECLKLFYTAADNRGKKRSVTTLNTNLRAFLNTNYTEVKIVENTVHLYNFLKYEAEDMAKNYSNSLKFNFSTKVKKYIDKHFKLDVFDEDNKGLEDKLRRQLKQELKRDLEAVKKDILEYRTPKSKEDYREFVDSMKTTLTSCSKVIFESINYDVKVSPFDYLIPALELQLDVLPLRRSFIPAYMTLDNECLMRLTKTLSKEKLTYEERWKKYTFLHELPQFKKYVKKRYKFDYIKTDGYGVSVLMKKIGKKSNNSEEETEKYIDSNDFLTERQNKNIVGIDPGKEDLIFCTDEKSTFRYSQVQRSRETRKKKFRRKVDRLRDTVVELSLTVKDIEKELSNYNSHSSDYSTFIEYIKCKQRTEDECRQVYESRQLRQDRWRKHILKQKSESKMLNNFKKQFGGPEEVVVAIGDWEQSQRIKFKEPTLGKGIRTIFRRNGYSVYLVDEFRTSCTCYQCKGENKNFLTRKNPRPWMSGSQTVHGLLRCTTCSRYWNRDFNSSLNIRSLAVSSPDRPAALSRQRTTLHAATNEVPSVGTESGYSLDVLVSSSIHDV